MSQNVEFVVKANKLIVTMDIGPGALKAATPSKSGKTNLVASTNGSVKVNDEISLSLNLMQKTG